MAKKKKQVQEPKQPREAAKDLQDKVGAIKALVSTHELLNQSTFPGYASKRVTESIAFIETLYKQLKQEAEAHPDADLIPGLVVKQEPQNV